MYTVSIWKTRLIDIGYSKITLLYHEYALIFNINWGIKCQQSFHTFSVWWNMMETRSLFVLLLIGFILIAYIEGLLRRLISI